RLRSPLDLRLSRVPGCGLRRARSMESEPSSRLTRLLSPSFQVQKLTMRPRVLVVALPAIALAPLANHFWRIDTVYAYWVADISLRVVIPTLCLWILFKAQSVKPSDYGFSLTLRGFTVGEFVALCALSTLALFSYTLVDGAARAFMDETSVSKTV